MIDVYIAYAQRGNPGPSAICVLGVVDDQPHAHTRIRFKDTEGFHATWLAINLALQRAAIARKPAVTIYTNLNQFHHVEDRTLPAAGANEEKIYWSLAVAAHERLRVTGSMVRWAGQHPTKGAPWLDQARAAASVALASALDRRRAR